MQEIEVKVKINNRDELITKLIELGCQISESVFQKDVIFLKDNKNFEIKPGDKIIRIRQKNNKNIVTLKQRKTIINESKEIEFEVDDYNAAYDFIDSVDYKEVVTVEKRRENTKYEQYNLCIDEVERLGTFLEVEVLTEIENIGDKIKKEILQFIKNLNLTNYEIIEDHYDTMIWRLDNK